MERLKLFLTIKNIHVWLNFANIKLPKLCEKMCYGLSRQYFLVKIPKCTDILHKNNSTHINMAKVKHDSGAHHAFVTPVISPSRNKQH